MNDLIQIDLGKLNKEKPKGLIIAKDGKLALDAEMELKKILDTKELIDGIVDYVKERLGEEMGKRKLIKVKAGSITISKRYFGSRYKLNGAVEEFTTHKEYDLPNVEAIDLYYTENGKLPDGVELRDREEKVSILRREEDQ